jgi:hypothetical protein
MGDCGSVSMASAILAEPTSISIYWRQNRKKYLQMVNQSLSKFHDNVGLGHVNWKLIGNALLTQCIALIARKWLAKAQRN